MILESSSVILDEYEIVPLVCNGANVVSKRFVIARAATLSPKREHVTVTV